MKRRVIQLAGKTLVMSLPSKWARDHDIKKGDEIDVQEDGSDLVVSTGKRLKGEHAEIKIYSKKHFLRRIVDNPYRLGYDSATFYYDDPEIFNLIQREVNNLMGFEIIKQGKNYCIMKNLAQGIEEQFETILHRLIRITISMAQEVVDALRENNMEALEKIEKMEDTNNKFTHFCKRMINTRGYVKAARNTFVYRTVCLFEEIGDELRDICKNCRRYQLSCSKEVLDLFEGVIKHLQNYHQLFSKYDSSKVIEYGKEDKRLEGALLDSLVQAKDPFLVHYLLTILGKSKHLSEDLME